VSSVVKILYVQASSKLQVAMQLIFKVICVPPPQFRTWLGEASQQMAGMGVPLLALDDVP
jgi:hypothetical protein